MVPMIGISVITSVLFSAMNVVETAEVKLNVE